MAIRTKEEIIASFNNIVGDRSDDDTLAMLEDLSDTLADYEAARSTDWEAKYNDLDAQWRERYRKRFTSDGYAKEVIGIENVAEPNDTRSEAEKTKYEDLFKEE